MAPITNTFAANTVPAAVVSIGKYLAQASAASSAPLYPPMLAIDESVSMPCARVVRGTQSVANADTPRSANCRAACVLRVGISVPSHTAPRRSSAIPPASRGCTPQTKSAADSSADRSAASVAPASVYCSSG